MFLLDESLFDKLALGSDHLEPVVDAFPHTPVRRSKFGSPATAMSEFIGDLLCITSLGSGPQYFAV